ncbi:preprotein translocase subunit SecE, partial [Adlercreutzia equolifaciens]|uniref:preprotein translocase subunit SecE n=1 Tax=Adlercreutzia equolifaciens TaxID=446660 RepID=UPI003AF43261
MAKKSKTQRAKASAARQRRKAEREQEALNPTVEAAPAEEEKPKRTLFKKSDDGKAAQGSEPKKSPKKAEAKPKKKRFQFFRDVKTEMKRVTWPTRTDVLRWSGVVVVALLFFGVFVAVLDNAIITPLL